MKNSPTHFTGIRQLVFYLFSYPLTPWVHHPLSERTRGVTIPDLDDSSESRGLTAVTQNSVNCACILTGCPEHIYDLRRVSLFYWLLSHIKASFCLPCTSSINISPLSSHFSTFHRNILSEHVCHNCQRDLSVQFLHP